MVSCLDGNDVAKQALCHLPAHDYLRTRPPGGAAGRMNFIGHPGYFLTTWISLRPLPISRCFLFDKAGSGPFSAWRRAQ
jgi:hypothetical protein